MPRNLYPEVLLETSPYSTSGGEKMGTGLETILGVFLCIPKEDLYFPLVQVQSVGKSTLNCLSKVRACEYCLPTLQQVE